MLVITKTSKFTITSFPANSGRRLSRVISLSTTFSVVVCVWGVRGQPGPHGAREKIIVIFLHTQIAGKFFVMNQSLSFSLSPFPLLFLTFLYSLLSCTKFLNNFFLHFINLFLFSLIYIFSLGFFTQPANFSY
jgi:hypothetical protein